MPVHNTRGAPNLSAIAPANGWPNPHKIFWIAIASANTSRPQPFVCDNGVRKKPSDERGPNVSTAIMQPHSASTIRQPKEEVTGVIGLVMESQFWSILGARP